MTPERLAEIRTALNDLDAYWLEDDSGWDGHDTEDLFDLADELLVEVERANGIEPPEDVEP